jgi:hypothetical protein
MRSDAKQQDRPNYHDHLCQRTAEDGEDAKDPTKSKNQQNLIETRPACSVAAATFASSVGKAHFLHSKISSLCPSVCVLRGANQFPFCRLDSTSFAD